jgi:glycerol-3-phosphate acyltransferase PlsY
LLTLGAYLLGAGPAAYLVARLSRGIDLRRYGSGSIGASNLWQSTSRWIAMPIIPYDLGKGMLAVWIAQLVGLDVTQQVIVGLATIVGHNWSVFLRFGGGRGMLTTLGVALILPLINGMVPWGVIVALIIAAIGTFVIHSVPLGVGAAVTALPLVSWAVGDPLPITLGFLVIFLITVIKRLAMPRIAIAASLSNRQLLLNRLLFDRDIRDRKAWIHRAPLEASSTEQPQPEEKEKG